MTLAPHRWAELGVTAATAVDDRRRSPGHLLLVFLVVAPVVMVRSSAALAGSRWLLMAPVVLTATLALRALPASAWPARAGVALAAGAGAVPLAGRAGGIWVAVTLVAAAWSLLGIAPVPGLRAPPSAAGAAPVAIAAVTFVRVGSSTSASVLLVPAAAMVVVALVGAVAGARLMTVVDGFARWVGAATSRALFMAIAVPFVLMPWLVHRVLRVDPLEQPRPEGSSWLDRSGEPVRPEALWRRDAAALALPAGSLARRLLAAVVLAGAFGAVLVPATIAIRDRDRGRSAAGGGAHSNTDPNAVPAALADAEWYPEYQQDIAWLWQTGVAWDPLAPVRLRDVHTRHVNIVDGARTSWRPPACDCRRLRVWLYGGSTTFGLGQRDAHTTASALARRAWADGIAVDVVNRGVVGDTHWEEAQRLAWDLATLEPPDLVVFLDGINDTQAVDRLTGETRQPLSFVKADFWKNFLDTGGAASMDSRWAPGSTDGGNPPPGAAKVEVPPVAKQTPDQLGALVSGRYETARRVSAALGRADSVPIEWFWQPSIDSRPAVDGEPPPAGRAYADEVDQVAIAGLGPEVHNVTGALDGIDEPLYWDQYHTNERGATLVASAMYAELRGRLVTLVDGGR